VDVSLPSRPPTNARAYGFDAAYAAGAPNWDVGRPQAPFVHLEEAGLLPRRVLEVGCGTGELSLFLARNGHEVLGVDFSPRAVAAAREKARWRRVDAHFLVWDALDLPALGVTPDAVVDSAMFHCLSDADPGGVYVLLGDHRPDARPVSDGGVSRAELRERFRSPDWRVAFVVETRFQRRGGWNRALLAGVERVAGER
jgi:SAM-dependent methyltransferase